MKTFLRTAFCFSILAFISSCDLINPEEKVPAYLDIQPFSLSTLPGSQGSSDEKITEVWVFVDGAFLGSYDLPALVPVLNIGTTEIRLEAGIRDNGLSAKPDIYPFYAPYTTTLNLEPGKTETIQPVITYSGDAKFAFIEDFEDNRPRIFTMEILGETPLGRTTDDVFEGGYSGQFSLTRDSRPVVEIGTSASFSGLQDGGVFVYLEVNYKSDVPVSWGIIGEIDPAVGPEGFYDPGFVAKDEWNKIYFNISQLIFDVNVEDYQIGFQAFLTEASPDSATVLLDNIKLVHF